MTTEVLCTELANRAPENSVAVRLLDSNYVPGFSRGGLADYAEATRKAGRYGDDILVHMTQDEFKELADAWGPYTINPDTGMPEYFLKKLFRKAKKFVKRVLKNPLVKAIAPIAMNMFLPGVGGLIGQSLFGAASASASGGNPLMGALSGVGGHFLGGGGTKAGGGGFSLGNIGAGGEGPLSRVGQYFGGPSTPGIAGGPGGLQGIDMSTLPGRMSASGQIIPRTGGGIGGAMSRFFRDPNTGKIRWGRALGAGAAGLGALSLLGQSGGDQGDGPPPRPEGFDDPLPNLSWDREQIPVDDYYRYGQASGPGGGGEQMFFRNNRLPQGGNTGNSALDIVGTPQGGALSQVNPGTVPGDLARHFPGMSPQDIAEHMLPRMFKGGGEVAGKGTGRSDEIPAVLSDGEYVIDAESVALLGDGSTRAGAKKLDGMRTGLRKHKGGGLAKGEFSADAKSPEEYMAKGGEPKKKRAAKKEGGKVDTSALKKLAAKFESTLASGNAKRVSEIAAQMESLSPGLSEFAADHFAKGGQVGHLVKRYTEDKARRAKRART